MTAVRNPKGIVPFYSWHTVKWEMQYEYVTECGLHIHVARSETAHTVTQETTGPRCTTRACGLTRT